MRLKWAVLLFPTFLDTGADLSALHIQRTEDEGGWINPETGSKDSVN